VIDQSQYAHAFGAAPEQEPETEPDGPLPIGKLRMDARDAEYADFVRSQTRALLRAAYLLTGDQHLAEDLVQEALARTHRAWDRLRHTEHATAYARKVMYHAQVSSWRRRRIAEVLPGTGLEQHGGWVDDLADAAAQRVMLRRALLALSPKQRSVIVLRYFEDHTEAEAAQLLGISVSTVKTQCARGLERLRMLLPDLGALADSEASR
jgi:RNA polymerase sigma-70 factor (sigma-E family)